MDGNPPKKNLILCMRLELICILNGYENRGHDRKWTEIPPKKIKYYLCMQFELFCALHGYENRGHDSKWTENSPKKEINIMHAA